MARVVTSLQNQRVKDASKLRGRRAREKQGRIIIDGAREIHRALDNEINIVELFVCVDECTSDDSRQVIELASDSCKRIDVTASVFEKLCYGQRSEGLVAVATTPQCRLADFSLGDAPLIAVLEGIEKPGNVGAVLRSADGAGIDAVVLADSQSDLYNPNAIRASLGAIFAIPVCCATSVETKTWLNNHQIQIIAADVTATREFDDADLTGGTAVVLGSEASGLSNTWRAEDISSVRLPMLGVCDSLNVSATAAVLFYEARRQRKSEK